MQQFKSQERDGGAHDSFIILNCPFSTDSKIGIDQILPLSVPKWFSLPSSPPDLQIGDTNELMG